MINLGLVSAASYGYSEQPRRPGSNHGTAFATAFNGWDEEESKKCEGVFVKTTVRISGARVTRVWDPMTSAAVQMARACHIERVCSSAEECMTGVDAVILIDDGSGEQFRFAEGPLQRGVPVFCDKPLAMTTRDASSVVQLARRRKTKLMSCSALRFVKDILDLKAELPKLGGVHLATVACGNDMIYYGIHALSMAYAVLGAGAVSSFNVGQPGLNQARIRFSDHRDVIAIVGEPSWMASGYRIDLFGRKAWRSVTPNLSNLYNPMLEAFLQFVTTGVEPYPIEEEVELIAALEASKRSMQLGREVMISEVLS